MAGFVYIMSNPLFSLIKIGKSTKDPTKDRLNQLNSETGTPEKFKCEYYAFVGDEHGLEIGLHRQFSDRRPNPNREFFEVSILEVINAIRDTAPNFGGIKYEEIYYQDLRKIEYECGGVYDGEIKNNLRNGHGTYTWANGNQYVGEWRDNLQHGQGTFTSADSLTYIGNWKDGLKHGHGAITNSSGQQYVGEFRNDEMLDGEGPRSTSESQKSKGVKTKESGFFPIIIPVINITLFTFIFLYLFKLIVDYKLLEMLKSIF